MSFDKHVGRHMKHEMVIRHRVFRNGYWVPSLHCKPCNKLIKWLSYRELDQLVEAGVEQAECRNISIDEILK